MTLRPGDTSEEELGNEHRHSEQWLYVVAGSGRVRIASTPKSVHTQPLKAGDLLLIEKGEQHQVKNTGKKILRTIDRCDTK